MMKKITLGVLALIVVLVVLALVPAMLPDEELLPGARDWLAQAANPPTVPVDENRFFALVGFQAAEGEPVTGTGAMLVASANAVVTDPKADQSEVSAAITASAELESIDFESVAGDPAGWLKSNIELVDALEKQNDILLRRYREIMRMPAYSFTLVPHYRTTFPNYANITRIHRLNTLIRAAAIQRAASTGDAARMQQRLDDLVNQFEYLRLWLRQSETLIEKLVAAAMLRFDLQVYGALLNHPMMTEMHGPLANLDSETLSMERPYRWEFAMGETILSDPPKGENLDWVDHLLMNLYLKPNLVQNRAYEFIWQRQLARESSPLAERGEVDFNVGEAYSAWDVIRDPAGYVLLGIAMPALTYLERLEHVDGLITLVNTKAAFLREPRPPTDIDAWLSRINAATNPGYRDARIRWNDADAALYFEIPGYDAGKHSNPNAKPGVLKVAG